MFNRIRRKAGFTLLEAMVAVGILSGVSFVLFELLLQSERGFEFSLLSNQNNIETRTALSKCSDLLKGAQILGIEEGSQSQPCVVFQIPVDTQGDGDVVDSSGNVEWGAEGVLGRVYLLVFVSTENWSEQARKRDFNGDGDENDYFVRGDLRLRTYSSIGSVINGNNLSYTGSAALTDEILVSGLYSGLTSSSDIDGDGVADKMFNSDENNDMDLDGNGTLDTAISPSYTSLIEMKFGVVRVDSTKHVNRVVKTERVRMRNPQSTLCYVYSAGVKIYP